MNKKDLREKIITKRNSLSQEQIKKLSDKIFNQLYSSPIYNEAATIMSYVSIEKEIFTHNFIKEAMEDGKKILIPVTRPAKKEIILSHLIDFNKDLEMGHWGLLEPKKETLRLQSSEILDLILVPGLAFTENGHRLGYGGGYYDRFLSSLTKPVTTISLAFKFQIIETLPIESFDVPVDYILTEEKLIYCKNYRED
jgi:5-formyltetrahydrofolate cyclo-ligase